ncbi:interferon-induced transmembrane protein 5-like [Rhynochetos jubatus]
MKPRQAEVAIPLQPPKRGAPSATAPQPGDYMLWSMFNILVGHALTYLGCCCFPALVFSIKARDRKVLGDLEGARRHAARAKVLNIVFSVLLAVGVLAVIAIVVTTTTT